MISSQQLTECDKEPIHIPSRIQNNGYMLVVESETHNIIQLSINTEKLFKSKAENILGKNISEYFDAAFIQSIENIKGSQNDNNIPMNTILNDQEYFVAMHPKGNFYILELAVTDNTVYDTNQDTETIISKSLEHFSSDLDLQRLLEHISKSVKSISGFDRVLVYKFDDEGHGTVLAQAKEVFCENFLHHYFPASDIPKQARELYIKNRFRVIQDVNSTTFDMIPNLNPLTNTPLDMSLCYLRAVSPIHIEYLKNMGVTSSMSISIVIDNKLWGLIACHNYSIKPIPLKSYRTYDLLSEIYSSQIENKELINDHKIVSKLQYKRQLFLKLLDSAEDINYKDAIKKYLKYLKESISCDICAVFDKEDIISSSKELTNEELRKLLSIFKDERQDGIFGCSKLGLNYPFVNRFSKKTGGMVCTEISQKHPIYLMFIRFEQVYYREWAGEPSKEVSYKNGIIQIDPRASFETWKECVKGTCEKFTQKEIDSVTVLSNQLNTVIEKFNSLLEARILKEENKKQKELFLSKKLESIQELIRNIAHQWRQPLNVISVSASGLKLKYELGNLDNVSLFKAINSIYNNTQYLSKTIDDFDLLLKKDQIHTKFKLVDLIDIFLMLVESLIEDNNINIVSNIKDDIEIEGYPNQLVQCFLSFFYNSKDAFLNKNIEKNDRFIFISQYKNHNGLIIEFKDTAGGISEDIHLKVFEPYFTTKHQYLGAGLGLSISYNFIKQSMGGDIKLENESFSFNGKRYFGTKVVLTLPYKE